VFEHSVKHDAGAVLRDGIKTLAKQGVCPEKLWPYAIKQFAKKPTPACYAQAKQHTISSYQRLATTAEMRACLAAGFPFVFGFTVYESFESATVARTGAVNLPIKGESAIGGHAVCAVGYDDKVKRFIVRNSWGVDWGKQGYFTMPYAYLADRNLSDDFWTMRKLGE
jgi:C1A family cysteine protease